MARSKLFSSTEPETQVEVEVGKLPEDAPEVIGEVVDTVLGNIVQVEMPTPATTPTYDKTHLDALQNLSQRIRYLNSRGLTNSQIVKVLKVNAKGSPLIYQHVRNVLLQKVKKSA